MEINHHPTTLKWLQELGETPEDLKELDEYEDQFFQLCEDLTTAGIGYIVADYDGSGDDGCINGVYVYRDEESYDQDRVRITHPVAVELSPSQLKRVEELLDHLLEYVGADFNNDGCCGEIRIDLVAGAVRVERNDRYTEYDTTEHVFVAKPAKPAKPEEL